MRPLTRLLLLLVVTVLGLFFVLPLLWFVFAPFNDHATLAVTLPSALSLANFQEVLDNDLAMRGLLQNSTIIGLGTMLATTAAAALAAYGISRSNLPGRQLFTYLLILFSSVVTGTASMVRSYEEAAMVAGASPLQIFRDVTFPLLRPGLMVVGIWVLVNAWGSFLTPFILLRDPNLLPAAVTFYQFYDEEGAPQITLVAAYAVLYTLPVLILYLLINWRYGFRFFGGIKQ